MKRWGEDRDGEMAKRCCNNVVPTRNKNQNGHSGVRRKWMTGKNTCRIELEAVYMNDVDDDEEVVIKVDPERRNDVYELNSLWM